MNGSGKLARMTFTAGEDFALRLANLGEDTEEIAKKAIKEGAGIVADAVRASLEAVVSDKATGEAAASLGITPITKDNAGYWNAKIGFDGYDHKGVPNRLKMRALESGTSCQIKRPFFRPAVRKVKDKAEQRMNEVIEQEIANRMR